MTKELRCHFSYEPSCHIERSRDISGFSYRGKRKRFLECASLGSEYQPARGSIRAPSFAIHSPFVIRHSPLCLTNRSIPRRLSMPVRNSVSAQAWVHTASSVLTSCLVQTAGCNITSPCADQ